MLNKVKIGIIICVLLLLGVAGFSWYTDSKKDDHLVKFKDNKLTTQETKTYEDRLSDINSKLKSAQSNDEKFNLYIEQGYNLYGLGRLDDASNAFDAAIELKPDDIVGYSALFQVQVDMADYEAARTSIKKAISFNLANADLWRKYIQLEQEKLGASKEVLNNLYIEALNKTNDSVDIMTVYADFLEQTGDTAKAIGMWEKAIAASPKNKTLYQTEIDRIKKSIK